MSEVYQLLGSYIFSGKFPIPIPTEVSNRGRVLFIDVFEYRPASSRFFNDRTNPPTGFLGTFTCLQEGMVLERKDVDFTAQRYYLQRSYDDQISYTQRCIDEAASQRDLLIAQLIDETVDLLPNAFRDELKSLHIFPDELRFVCYADVALKVDVYLLNVDICNNPEFPLPPPLPAQLPAPNPPIKIEAGESITAAAYSPQPPGTSAEDYEPFPGDVSGFEPPDIPVQPPVGLECQVVTVTISADFQGNEGVFTEFSAFYYAPIQGLRLVQLDVTNPSINEIQVLSRGLAGITGGPCIEEGYYPGILSNNINSFSLVNIQE